eukprot:2849164-Prymnesium_polylepis.1
MAFAHKSGWSSGIISIRFSFYVSCTGYRAHTPLHVWRFHPRVPDKKAAKRTPSAPAPSAHTHPRRP